MKKKPSMIFSILINILNNLKLNKEYSINELSEKSGLHWQTTNEYLKILLNLFKFSPKFKFNEENNRIQVIEYSNYYKNLSYNEQILINLYENKAFNEESALNIRQFYPEIDLKPIVEDLILKKQIEKDPSSDKYYITKLGKSIVISQYSAISKEVFEFSELKSGEESLESKYSEIIDNLMSQNKIIISQYNYVVSQNNKLLNWAINISQILENNLVKNVNLQQVSQTLETHNQIIPEQKNLNFINIFSYQPEKVSSNDDLNQINIDEFLKYCFNQVESQKKKEIEKYIKIE